MIPILAGMGSFLLQLVWDAPDVRSARKHPFGAHAARALRWLSSIACVVLYLGATIVLCADPWRLWIPLGVRLTACLFAVPFLLLLVQSLLVEVPGPLRIGSGGTRDLVTTGTYALVRHPGVLWYLFFHLLLGLAIGSVPFLLAAPLWAGLNTAVAAIQDRVLFPRVFGAPYEEYRRAVPFLIPRRAGIHRCLATLSLLRAGAANR